MEANDFIYEQQDDKGVRHRFFDFKKFSNFIEEDESNSKSEACLQKSSPKTKKPKKGGI